MASFHALELGSYFLWFLLYSLFTFKFPLSYSAQVCIGLFETRHFSVAQAGLKLSILLPQPLSAIILGMSHHTYVAFIFMCPHEPAACQVLKGPRERLPLQKQHANKTGSHPTIKAREPD